MVPLKRKKHGIALLSVLALTLVLLGVVYTAFTTGMRTSRSARLQDEYNRSLAAAEYGAEMAIVELSSGNDVGAGHELDNWVAGNSGENLFSVNGQTALDERRIGGLVDEHEFRVSIRSASLAHNENIVPETWLRNPGQYDPTSYTQFESSDVFVVTATAQPLRNTIGASPVVQAVVDVTYDHPLNSLLGQAGVLHMDTPSAFQPTLVLAETTAGDSISTGIPSGRAGESDLPTVSATNVTISGEDHYLITYAIEQYSALKSSEPLKLPAEEDNDFEVNGRYWQWGCLTLNYQVDNTAPNPYRPRVATFGTGTGQEMLAYDSSRPPDIYLLGGKRGKTVTLDENGKINELTDAEAAVGGEFNIVLNDFDDLMKLYISVGGVTQEGIFPVSEAFSNPSYWFQMYIGQYTQEPRSTKLSTDSFPTYGGTRIRPQTVQLLMNADGQYLVREYQDRNGNRHPYYDKDFEWTGKYTWIHGKFDNAKTVPVFVSTEAGSAGKTVTPRPFYWQELVGFSLAKRNGQHAGEPDLHADGSKRTFYELDGSGKRIPVGFDERYQSRANASNTTARLENRNDPIQIRQKDGSLKDHYTMNDFLYEKDFGIDDTGIEVRRKAVGLLVAYEEERESANNFNYADFNYTDFIFTIFIAPSSQNNGTIIKRMAKQWWERDNEDGLTGKPSHRPVTTNPVDEVKDWDDHFSRLSHDPKECLVDNIYTMHLADGSERVTFPRALFTRDENNLPTGVIDDSIFEEWSSQPHFYYSDGDIAEFMQRDPSSYYNPVTGEMDIAKAVAEILALNNGRVEIRPISGRWDEEQYERIGLVQRKPSSYHLLDKEIPVRQIAGKIVGYQVERVLGVKTKNFERLTNHDLGLTGDDPYPPASVVTLGFIAGEYLRPDLIEVMHHPAVPSLDVYFRHPDGSEKKIREYLADNPDDAVAMCYTGYYQNEPFAIDKIRELYGFKDKRHSIGFHRAGTDQKFEKSFARDNFEIILLGVRGFNPYREAIGKFSDQDPDEVFIAMEQIGDEENPDYTPRFKYGDDDDPPPDFVFDKPIDGAGAMVVNGNLIIRDDFAFHGTLVVLGDVIIQPERKVGQYVYGDDGNPLDAFGNSLILVDGISGNWGYQWINPYNLEDKRITHILLDDYGIPVPDEKGGTIRVEPLLETEYRGSLTVQGDLLIKGRLRTNSVATDSGDRVHGAVHLYWSSQAIRETADVWASGRYVARRVAWVHDDNIKVENLWNDTIE